jgi:heme exporter protein B
VGNGLFWTWARRVAAFVCKEALVESRGWRTIGLGAVLALTATVAFSLAFGPDGLEPRAAGSLLWLVVYFTVLGGAGGANGPDSGGGTADLLRLVADGGVVFAGKTLFAWGAALTTALGVGLLGTVLLPVSGEACWRFAVCAPAVTAGLAAAGTLLGLIVGRDQPPGQGSEPGTGPVVVVFAILITPVVLPLLVGAAAVTAGLVGWSALVWLYLLAGALVVSAAALFDILWEEN